MKRINLLINYSQIKRKELSEMAAKILQRFFKTIKFKREMQRRCMIKTNSLKIQSFCRIVLAKRAYKQYQMKNKANRIQEFYKRFSINQLNCRKKQKIK